MSQDHDPAAFERYRLMVISTWPDSELKRSALASARAALQRALVFNTDPTNATPPAPLSPWYPDPR
jgi:hypothetical protein